MSTHFLTKTTVDLAACLSIGEQLALEAHPALAAFLDRMAGAEAAALFAEPLMSRGNREAPPTISWYAAAEGEGRPITQLDGPARAEAEARLARMLAGLRPLLDDPDGGRLLGAALHVPSPEDVWVVEGRPVILNWGMLAAPDARDAVARTAQFSRTLGRYLPLATAPALTPEEQGAQRRERAGAQGEGSRAAAATGAGTAAPALGSQDAARVAEPGPRPGHPGGADGAAPAPRRGPPGAYGWVPLLVLLLLAGGSLAWLLLPGTRLFPPVPSAVVDAAEAERVARAVNESLIERRAALRGALDAAQCRADGTLVMPDGRTLEGLLPPRPGAPDAAPGSRTDASPTPLLPAPIERALAPGAAEGDGASLIDLIEARTVMVIASGPQPGTGSGFFVAPDLVITNFHVVEGADPARIFVTNSGLGSLRQATVLTAVGPLDVVGADFALLRVPGAAQPFFDILDTDTTLKLQSVIAAGYPGDILESDAAFAELRAGNAAAVPELTVTDGLVSTEQTLANRSRLVVHSAAISRGNSGGPLIDYCGRVVGVNTFVRQGPMRNLNFALGAKDLLAFMGSAGAQATVVTQVCQPVLLRPAVPPPVAPVPAATPAPGPGAAPEAAAGAAAPPATTLPTLPAPPPQPAPTQAPGGPATAMPSLPAAPPPAGGGLPSLPSAPSTAP
jgi:S1-C subfamily serine protease